MNTNQKVGCVGWRAGSKDLGNMLIECIFLIAHAMSALGPHAKSIFTCIQANLNQVLLTSMGLASDIDIKHIPSESQNTLTFL